MKTKTWEADCQIDLPAKCSSKVYVNLTTASTAKFEQASEHYHNEIVSYHFKFLLCPSKANHQTTQNQLTGSGDGPLSWLYSQSPWSPAVRTTLCQRYPGKVMNLRPNSWGSAILRWDLSKQPPARVWHVSIPGWSCRTGSARVPFHSKVVQQIELAWISNPSALSLYTLEEAQSIVAA